MPIDRAAPANPTSPTSPPTSGFTGWDWRERLAPERSGAPALRAKRRRAAIHSLVGLVVAGGAAWLGHPLLAGIATGLALATFGLSWLWPAAHAGWERALTALGEGVGAVVGFVLVGLILYAILTPLGLFLRLRGRLRLSARWDRSPATSSTWRDIPPARSDAYSRQF
jgi:hypothetical protein